MYTGHEAYVLGNERTRDAVERFLNRFMPRRTENQDEYPIPEHSGNPEIMFDNAMDLVDYLEHHPNESYGLYWNNAVPGPPYQAMVFFTSDGGIILGLVYASEKQQSVLESLADSVGATFGYVTSEERPPDTTEDFVQGCLRSRHNGIPSLIGR